MTKTISVELTAGQIAEIRNDKQTLAKLINEGNCCKFLDMGLSLIDLYALHVSLVKALDKTL